MIALRAQPRSRRRGQEDRLGLACAPRNTLVPSTMPVEKIRMGKVPVALVKTGAGTGVVASVTLSLRLRPPRQRPSTTAAAPGRGLGDAGTSSSPPSVRARCDSASRLLRSRAGGLSRGPTGTETATEWNDDSPLAMLLQSNPYEEEMTERAERWRARPSQSSAPRRGWQDRQGQEARKGKWTLNVTCKNKVGTTTKPTTSRWWGVQRRPEAVGAGRVGRRRPLSRQAGVERASDGAIFQVEATFKNGRRARSGCSR